MSLSRFSIIVAIDAGNGIAKDGGIPWSSKSDQRYFREVTHGRGKNAVIMGRNTWSSLPSRYKPLPKRENIVLTTETDKPIISNDNDTPNFMPSLKETIKYCEKKQIDQMWIIGGEILYKTALNSVNIDSIHITHIDNDFPCDTFFPIVPSYFHLDSETSWAKENEISYRFEKYIFKDTLEDPALYFAK